MRPDEYPNQREDELPDKELEIVEFEPDAERMDDFIPVIDLMTITKEELRRLLQNVIPEA
jgi:hypothetical protein